MIHKVETSMQPTKKSQKQIDLPLDILYEIFSFCEHIDLCNFSIVNQDWYKASNNVILWKHLCLRRWTFCRVENNAWKKYYIYNHTLGKRWERGRSNADYKVLTLRGHKGYINYFELRNDVIVSVSSDLKMIVWSQKNAQFERLHSLVPHKKKINCVKLTKGA